MDPVESHGTSAVINAAGLLVFAIVAPLLLVQVATAGDLVGTGILVTYVTVSLVFWAVQMGYHLFMRAERSSLLFRNLDRGTTLFLIAGIFTPCLARYGQEPGTTIISGFLWTGAVVGMVLLISWRNIPRVITPLLSFALGIVGIITMVVFIAAVPVPGIISFIGGASFLVAGGVIYAMKKPNLLPGKFGFHDLYHAMTLAGMLLLHVLVWFASSMW